jgi:transcriptional regulator with XRE-family HTH domain
MNGQTEAAPIDPAIKIARLVEERGWNQEDFARNAGLNRQTVRQILQPNGDRRLRNATVGACARALGFSVSEIRTLPLERLLRMQSRTPARDEETSRRLYERATQPELLAWIERNPERAGQLCPAEIDELLSLQGTGGHLTSFGVERFVECIERRRRLHVQIDVIAGTEYLDVLESIVSLMYEKVQPYRDRA